MKKVISILTCLCLLMTTGCSRQETIRFGAAGVGGMYYPFANALLSLRQRMKRELTGRSKVPQGLQQICVCFPTIILSLALPRRI